MGETDADGGSRNRPPIFGRRTRWQLLLSAGLLIFSIWRAYTEVASRDGAGVAVVSVAGTCALALGAVYLGLVLWRTRFRLRRLVLQRQFPAARVFDAVRTGSLRDAAADAGMAGYPSGMTVVADPGAFGLSAAQVDELVLHLEHRRRTAAATD